jgi:hypothetical protein
MGAPSRITATDLRRLLADLRAGRDAAIGTWLYRGLRVQVSRYGASGTERSARLYGVRRRRGLCVRCGARVTRRNPVTGRPYRLCEEHRRAIDGA